VLNISIALFLLIHIAILLSLFSDGKTEALGGKMSFRARMRFQMCLGVDKVPKP
jgi:hypothetical protein